MAVKDWPKVAIIVLNWNGWRDTIECLESLQCIKYPNYEIIVVDNGSTDDSVEKLKEWAIKRWGPSLLAQKGREESEFQLRHGVLLSTNIFLVQLPHNLGYAGGNNAGIRLALEHGATYIWILNNDTVVDSYSLSEMVRIAETDPRIGVVGAKILFYENPDVIYETWADVILWAGLAFLHGYRKRDQGQLETTREVHFVSGACMLVRSETVESVGLIDESFFMYCEEVDWQIRMRKAGWKIVYCTSAKIWHKGGSSIGYGSSRHLYYVTKNSIRLVRRYSKHTLPLACTAHVLRLMRRLLRGQVSLAWAIANGILDGVRER